MKRFQRHIIQNLKEDIILEDAINKVESVSNKIAFWDTTLLIVTFCVTVVFTVLPLIFQHCFSNINTIWQICTYILLAVAFCIFAIWAYCLKRNYCIIRTDFEKEEKEQEINKYRNVPYEQEVEFQMETFASIVQEVVDAQRNEAMSVRNFTRVITNHILVECQRRYGKDISVALYDMNPDGGITLQSFSSMIQKIDRPELYEKGTVDSKNESIANKFYTFCLTDPDDEIYDLPNRKAIENVFDFRKVQADKGKKERKKRKTHKYNQYISFKLKTFDNHTLLIEIVAHNSTVIGKADSLRNIAIDMCWRYGSLIQSYWKLLVY